MKFGALKRLWQLLEPLPFSATNWSLWLIVVFFRIWTWRRAGTSSRFLRTACKNWAQRHVNKFVSRTTSAACFWWELSVQMSLLLTTVFPKTLWRVSTVNTLPFWIHMHTLTNGGEMTKLWTSTPWRPKTPWRAVWRCCLFPSWTLTPLSIPCGSTLKQVSVIESWRPGNLSLTSQGMTSQMWPVIYFTSSPFQTFVSFQIRQILMLTSILWACMRLSWMIRLWTMTQENYAWKRPYISTKKILTLNNA